MSDANNFARVDRVAVSSLNVNTRVVKGACELHVDPAFYENNTLQWQFRSVPEVVPEQAPNHMNRLLATGIFPGLDRAQ